MASAYLTLPDDLAVLIRSTGAVAQTLAETAAERYIEIIGRLAWDTTARRLIVSATFIHTVGGASSAEEKPSIAALLTTNTKTEPAADVNLYWRALNDAIEELDEETRNEINDAYRAQLEMRGFPHEPA